MKDNRSKLAVYWAASKRLLMWNLLSSPLNLILITEFPKSGASWLCQMLSDASNIPFPRNASPSFKQCIMHGHHLFNPRMCQAVAVLRDGRDVMASAYFHFLFNNDHNKPEGVRYHRDKLQFEDYNDVKVNMPRFVDYMFTDYPKKNRYHFSWSEFVKNVYEYKDRLCIIQYEQLLVNPMSCLKRAIEFYQLPYLDETELEEVIERYSFKKVAQRDPGEENRNSFIRKGISGDWKNYFTEEACEIFKRYGGHELILAGYEKDMNWNNNY